MKQFERTFRNRCLFVHLCMTTNRDMLEEIGMYIRSEGLEVEEGGNMDKVAGRKGRRDVPQTCPWREIEREQLSQQAITMCTQQIHSRHDGGQSDGIYIGKYATRAKCIHALRR